MSIDDSNLNLRQKPPTQEDEFFAREDRERIEQLKEERRRREEREGAEKLKNAHFMHCPKCGNKLMEVEHRGMLVDRCTHCNGVWLDASEAETLSKKHGLVGSLFSW